MARTNNVRTKKTSLSKANAIGFSKRQSRKAKSSAGLSDVYEFQPEKVRRSKVALALGRDEAAEFGQVNHSDDEEDEHPSKRARLIGENKDDEMIDSEDDEDIDSDAAFGASDEETFAGYGFSRQTKSYKASKMQGRVRSKTRFADVDLNEDSSDSGVIDVSENGDDSQEEEGEGDPDEFVDVLDILDGRVEAESDSDTGLDHKENSRKEQDVGNDGSDDDDDDEDSEEEQQFDRIIHSEDEDENPEALDHLGVFISNLEASSKRKIPDEDLPTPPGSPRVKKRKLLKERTEAGTESEFAAGLPSGQAKLNLDDLLAPLASQSSNLISLKKSTKALLSSKGKALSAPLPQRAQERLDREAAYEQTKEEVDKWHPTMKRIKEAEHLSFPLQSQSTSQPSNLELVAKFKPTTSLETSVDKLLRQANMLDSDIQKTESLKMNHLSLEEVTARRGELRKMRDLMFRAEVKAKRLAKIKSKTYRRLKRKGKQNLMDKLEDGEGENDDETKLKREVQRARERATLKHKNTGKWAKAMKARGELDDDQKKDVMEMLERGEKLTRKIRGDIGSDESDEESEDDNDVGPEQIRADAFEEISQLHAGTEAQGPKTGKGIFEMKFMKDAMARHNQKVQEIADDFLKELEGPADDGDGTRPGEGESGGVAIQRIGGRVTYQPGSLRLPQLRTINSLASDTSSVTLRSTDLRPDSPPEPPLKPPFIDEIPSAHSPTATNPWLTLQSIGSTKAPRKNNEILVGRSSVTAEKSKSRLQKRQRKQEEAKNNAMEDSVVDISVNEVINFSSSSVPRSTKQIPEESNNSDNSSENSELEDQEISLARKQKGKPDRSGVKAFKQRDLVGLAFAGDKVVQDFQEAKQREIRDDAPQEVDTTLPGWGSWGGIGTKKSPPKPHLIKKIAGVDPRAREDYNKAHVIISEKRDKKAAKYMVKDLPYPYTSKAQFERSMQTPIGTEWNTRIGFQRGTLPRVVKKPGIIIEPLEKLV